MKEADDAESSVTLCTKCYGKIGAGIWHDCTRKNKVQNMLLTYTPTTFQRFASRVIDTNDGAPVATLGPDKKPVTPVPTKKQLYTTESFNIISRDIGLSNRKADRLAQDLRAASGSRTIIEKGTAEKTRELNRQLDDYFESRKCNFRYEDTKTKEMRNFEQHTVVCNDIPGLIDKIIISRNIDAGNSIIRIGLDGGGGFVKICMSVFEMPSTNEEKNS